MKKGTNIFLFTLIFLLSFWDGKAQGNQQEVLRGLHWKITEGSALKILSSKFGLNPNVHKTKEYQELYKDQGKFVVLETNVAGYDLDLILKFINNELVGVEYLAFVDNELSTHSIYKNFYNGLSEKYSYPVCQRNNQHQKPNCCEYTTMFSYQLLGERLNNFGCANHSWDSEKSSTEIRIKACRRMYDGVNYVSVTYSPYGLSTINIKDKL